MTVRRFEGKVVLVTGAARGQGRAHAVRFAAEGADVVVADIASGALETVPYPVAGPGDLETTAGLVREHGGRALAAAVDVRDAGAVHALVQRTTAELGRVDVLVANAGICTVSPVERMPADVWHTTLDVNLTGTFNAVRAVLPQMVAGGSGRIVATASMAARSGWAGLGHYAASKWGVIGLIKSVALEVAGSGVTANVVCPGAVNTPMMHNPASYRLARPDLEAPTREDVEATFAAGNPIPVAYAEPDDISDTVLFLASEESRFITGATLAPACGAGAANV